jgi:outer membrane receptor protein involved in Fe transport
VALSYKVTPSNMYYVSASKGFRAGGENQPVPDFCGLLSNLDITPGVPSTYRSDTVWSYEIGNKAEVLDKRLQITTALYQMNWSNIQQSISLPNCFLFVTANQGAARARGGELELTAKPSSNFDVRAAIGFDDARITEQGAPGLPPVGARVAQIPELTGSASGTYSRALREGYVGFLSADFSYVGNSPSNTSSLGYPLVRPAYDLVNASVGLRHGKTELSLYGSNLTNARPNLGDINPISYVRHDGDGPDAPIIPRVGTLQPLTVGVQFRQRF